MDGASWVTETSRARIEIYDVDEALVVIWTGTVMREECEAYLPELARRLAIRCRPVKLVYDLSALRGFDRETLWSHADFSKEQGDRITKIGVVTESAAHIAGVTAVNVLQKRPLKSFSTVEEALAW